MLTVVNTEPDIKMEIFMAIIRYAKNYKVLTKKQDTIIAGKIDIAAKKIIIEALDGNLELNSVKKVKIDGRG